jgi:hypothetical protein
VLLRLLTHGDVKVDFVGHPQTEIPPRIIVRRLHQDKDWMRGACSSSFRVQCVDLDYSATRSATGVRHGDTVGVESDAFCVYRRGKQVRVDLLGYLRIRRPGVQIPPGTPAHCFSLNPKLVGGKVP